MRCGLDWVRSRRKADAGSVLKIHAASVVLILCGFAVTITNVALMRSVCSSVEFPDQATVSACSQPRRLPFCKIATAFATAFAWAYSSASRSITSGACTPRLAPPASNDEWLPLRLAIEGTPYSQEYLSLLARTGRLEAVKRGKVWYTTHRAIEDYRQSVTAA